MQQAHKILCFPVCEATQHEALSVLDRRRHASQGSPSRNSHRQLARPPVPAAFPALDEPFLDQPIDHPGDGGTIKGNQSRKSDLIDPGVGADGRKRRVLNGRKAVTRPLDLRQEHGHRDLLEAARQVSGHFIDCLHDYLPREAQVDQYTDHQYTEQ